MALIFLGKKEIEKLQEFKHWLEFNKIYENTHT
jgi:hypothetical protein